MLLLLVIKRFFCFLIFTFFIFSFNPFIKRSIFPLGKRNNWKQCKNCKWKDSNIVIANQLIPFHFEFECDGQFLSSTPNRKELLVLNVCFKCQLQFLRIKSMQSFIWNQIWLQHSIQIPFILGHWLGTFSRPRKEKKSRIESNWFWQSLLLCYLLLFFCSNINSIHPTSSLSIQGWSSNRSRRKKRIRFRSKVTDEMG